MIRKVIVDLEIMSIEGQEQDCDDRPVLTLESDPGYSSRTTILTRDGRISVITRDLLDAIEKVTR